VIATAGFVLGRIAAVLFCLATWTYGITTYSPFAFDMFVRPQLFAPLTTFVIWHHVFYWIAFLASAATLVPDIRHAQRASARWAAIGYVLVFGGVGVYLLGNPYLAGLDSASRAPWAVHGALLPLLWLAVVDHLSARVTFGQRDDAATSQGQLIRACGATAAALWFGHAVTAAIRGRLLDDPQRSPGRSPST
jgi:hypothetical protein